MLTRMRALILVLALLLPVLILVLSGCRGKNTSALTPTGTTTPAANYRTYTSSKGYTIDFPNDWTTPPSPSPMVDVMAVRPETTAGTFKENINVVVETPPQQVSTEQVYQINKQMMTQQMPQFSEVASTSFTSPAVGGMKMVYTWNGGRALKNCVYFFTSNGKVYTVTGTATPETFTQYEPTFDQIARTLKP